MSKEMVISANPHETRVAILEEGQLCEYYVEREKEFALVGSIYKGKVTRVLPGMQSAFVEIGLDSDAFLYVSDFLEDIEDFDHIVTTVEDKVQKMEAQGGQVFPASGVTVPALEPTDVEAAAVRCDRRIRSATSDRYHSTERRRSFARNRAITLLQAVHDLKIAGTVMAVIEADAISEAEAGADGTIAVAAEDAEATVDLGASFHRRSTLHHGLSKTVPQTRQLRGRACVDYFAGRVFGKVSRQASRICAIRHFR